MAQVYKLTDPFVIAQANIIRSKESSSQDLKKALYHIGSELGKKIIEEFYLKERKITTPMEYDIDEAIFPDIPLSAVFTTKDDMQYYAKGLGEVLENCVLGCMDFEGRRGLQALNSPIREIELPDVKNEAVDSLIIAKSTLATGCTAVSLTKTALTHFLPRRLIIATIFYSVKGLNYLKRELPNAHIFVVGKPDLLDKGGMLLPGIGNLDRRLRG